MITEQDIKQAVKERREPNITFLMLAEMFGDDENARKSAQTRIRSLTRQRNQLLRPSLLVNKNLRWVRDEVNKLEADTIDKQIKYYRNFLNASDPVKKEEMKTRGVSEFDIARAKEVPITSLVEFKRGFAICPFCGGGERTASLHLIPNTNETKAHCFGGCSGKTHDAISAYMFFNNCNFMDAVSKLSGL